MPIDCLWSSCGSLNRGAFDFAVLGIMLRMGFINLLLNSLDSFVGESFIFEHCFNVSLGTHLAYVAQHLQKANSSRVRLCVSGYMRYTNMNSKEIQPQ